MCSIIIIKKGLKEIATPRQFKEHFGFLPDKNIHYDSIEMDCCLCQCDIEKTFNEKNISFELDCGDFFVDDN